MPQVFNRGANGLARMSLVILGLVVTSLALTLNELQRSPYVTKQGERLEQPVPFSHQHHVAGLGLDCRYCHTSVENSSFAGIPPTKTCMNCHSQIWTNAPMLEPVRESFRTGNSLNWERVHDLPDFVYFDHSIHINKGVGCESCHGPVDKMPLMYQANSLQMEWCLDCHRAPDKYLRPKYVAGNPNNQVFNMTYEQPSANNKVTVNFTKHPEWSGTYTEQRNAEGTGLGQRLIKEYGIRTPREITSCSTCHR
jgi:Cytochrome c7 and related cytochrome c